MAKYIKRRDRILDYVVQHTRTELRDQSTSNITGLDTTQISEALDIDRANVSRELNALYYNTDLIKLLGRPVRYLSSHELHTIYKDIFFPSTIPVGNNIVDYIKGYDSISDDDANSIDFKHFINAGDSIQAATDLIQAALLYPPHGLHMFITGEHGTGKRRLVHQIFDYGKKIGVFSSFGQLCSLECQDFSGSPQLLASQIFGNVKHAFPGMETARKGLFAAGKGGILFINEIQNLPEKVLLRFLSSVKQYEYTRIGEGTKSKKVELMIIATCSDVENSVKIQQLINSFPVHINLPSLHERTAKEILTCVLQSIQEEAKDIGREIHVSKDALYYLASYKYTGNISELQHTIKSSCANSMQNSDANRGSTIPVYLNTYNLTDLMKNNMVINRSNIFEISLRSTLALFPVDPIVLSPAVPITIPRTNEESEYPQLSSTAHEEGPNTFNEMLIKNVVESHLRFAYEKEHLGESAQALNPGLVSHITNMLLNEVNIEKKLAERTITGFINSLCSTSQAGFKIEPLISFKDETRNALSVRKEYRIAQNICKIVEQYYSITLSEETVLFATIYLDFLQRWPYADKTRIVIAFHGNGVSEGIADYLRHSCDLAIRSVNYDSDTSMVQINKQVADICQGDDSSGASYIVFSDMEPLNSIHCFFSECSGSKAMCINEYTLSKIQEVICKISQFNYSPEMISEDTQKEIFSESEHSKRSDLYRSINCSPFIRKIIDEIIRPSLIFLDSEKAAYSLLTVLNKICDRISIKCSDELSARFLFHCVPMLERVITGNTLPYYGLKNLISDYPNLLAVAEEEFIPLSRQFGTSIPISEVAYAAELLSSML